MYADIHLLLNYSTCFGRLSCPSSGVHKTAESATTVLCTPDDGRGGCPKHVE